MEALSVVFSSVASGIGPFFLLLGLLIFVHELGHYLVAVYFGVRVETFSLGFGKKLFSYKRGETTYCISLIPLGGYVKMYGDDPTAEIPEAEKKYSFLHKPVWPRIAIVLAGPLMNLFFAIVIFAAIGAIGEDVPSSQIGDIKEQTAAFNAGFRSGDKIESVNGVTVNQWAEVKVVVEDNATQVVTFQLRRELPISQNSQTHESSLTTVQMTPNLGKNEFLFTTKRMVGQIEGLSTESMAPIVGVYAPDSIAAKAGLKSFDLIETVGSQEIKYWRQLELAFKSALAGENGQFVPIKVISYDPDSKKSQSRTVQLAAADLNLDAPILPQLGLHSSDLFLMNIRPRSPAANAGLQKGDYVASVDGAAVTNWQSVLDRVKSFNPNQKQITFGIIRGGEPVTISVTPELTDLPTEQGAMESRYAIGVVPAIMNSPNPAYLLKANNPIKMISYGIEQSWVWSKLIAISFVRLVQNEVSARNIGGVISIGRVASKSYEAGLVAFLKMMAIISINLFILNLLPVPVLDGGHLVFFTIEALKGAPISFKKLEIAQQVGLVILLSLMLFALFNDITHLISSW
jgi:regulator of sigma E protease